MPTPSRLRLQKCRICEVLKIKGQSGWAILVGLVILGIVTGVINLGNINFGTESAVPQGASAESPAVSDVKICGDDGLADIRVRYRNGASTTATDYRANTLTAVDVTDPSNPRIFASYTPNSDGTFASTANALTCGRSYKLVSLNQPNAAPVSSEIKKVDSSAIEFDVVGANYTRFAANMYSLAFANETNTGNSFATGSRDFTTISNTALGTGDSLTIRFDIRATNSSAQLGAIERLCETETGVCGRLFVCITGDSAIYGKDDLSISAPFVIGRTSALTKLCSTSAPSNAGTGQVVYELDAIKSSAGTQSGTMFTKAGSGNPSDTQNVRHIYHEPCYYQGANNQLKIGTTNDANSDTCQSNNYMEVDIT